MKRLLLAITLIVVGTISVNGQERIYHDALAFELVDHPEYVITHEGMIVFNKDGSLNKEKSTALEGYNKYQIVRDNKGYPNKIITDNETITFKFDDMNMMLERHVKGAENYSEIFVRSQVNENGETPGEKFSPTYTMQTTRKEYIGSRSKNTTEDYFVITDSRGNWHTIKYSGIFFENEYESVDDFVDYRIITYHEPKYSYDTNGKDENDMTFIDILEKPFGLENGHEILQQPEKEIKKALKSHGIKCNSYGSIQNNTKTFYGYKFYASYAFLIDKTKANHYTVSGLKNVPYIGAHISSEDIFGFCISELIEKGIPVSVDVIGYSSNKVAVFAIFNYDGLRRRIFNNSTEIITYY